MEFEEDFGVTAVEGGGEDLLNASGPVTKTPKPKREKKEPGKHAKSGFRCCRVLPPAKFMGVFKGKLTWRHEAGCRFQYSLHMCPAEVLRSY